MGIFAKQVVSAGSKGALRRCHQRVFGCQKRCFVGPAEKAG
jgi:hypothetical protein